MNECTVHILDASDVFGWRSCGNAGDPMPHIGAGHSICKRHQLDQSIVIRDYHGATIIESQAKEASDV